MNNFKNNLKIVIGFLIGVILSGEIVYAVTFASQIDYRREGTNIENVEQALNDLYEKQNAHTQNSIVIETGTLNATNSSSSWQYNDVSFTNSHSTEPTYVFLDANAGSTGASVFVRTKSSSGFNFGIRRFTTIRKLNCKCFMGCYLGIIYTIK